MKIETLLPLGAVTVALDLCQPGPVASRHDDCNHVVRLLRDAPELNSLPVVDEAEHVIGVIRALDTLKHAAEPFFMDIYGRRSCEVLMDPKAQVFDADTEITQMATAVAELPERQLGDGFFVTSSGRYLGFGRMTDLLRAITESQVLAARHANPLTLLPGNVQIERTSTA
jgi:CBS-domain-containing membrane protein